MCASPGDCEGGPECLDDEGGPLVAPAEAGVDAGRGFLGGLTVREGELAGMMDRLAKDTVRSVQKPSVGRVAHYVSYGSPVREDGTQAYASECRAAIITEVYETDPVPEHGVPYVGLCVLNPTGQFFSRGVLYDEDRSGGSWHWPERVGDTSVTVTVKAPDPEAVTRTVLETVKNEVRRHGGGLK